MVKRPTLFIIGAGAGVDINMPVGATLSEEIGSKCDIRFEHATKQISGDAAVMSALRGIARERNEDPNLFREAGCLIKRGIHYTRSIDSYLYTHKDNERLKICAKLAIVQSILEHEDGSLLRIEKGKEPHFQQQGSVQNTWLSDFVYILQTGIVAAENLERLFDNLTMINFNYDRCIEYFLFNAIQSIFHINAARATQIMNSLNVIHPYGLVGYMPWDDGKRQVDFGVRDYGDIAGLSNEIRTFNEQIEDGDELEKLRQEVGAAEVIVFLGFHFHSQNMELLKPQGPVQKKGQVSVFGSARYRSDSDVEIIQKQIVDMLSLSGPPANLHVGNKYDCKGLFTEFGSTLALSMANS
jgi:hypothetical protein